MYTSTVTKKGQVTIPIEIRRALDLNQADEVEFRLRKNSIVVTRKENDITKTFGILKSKSSVTLKDMEAAIRKRGGCDCD